MRTEPEHPGPCMKEMPQDLVRNSFNIEDVMAVFAKQMTDALPSWALRRGHELEGIPQGGRKRGLRLR